MVAAITLLTALVLALGTFPWPRPEWSLSGLEILSTVPLALWLLVLGTAALCLAASAILTMTAAPMRPPQPAPVLWWVITVLAAGALVTNAIYGAALSTIASGAIIPILHWMFTFTPALLAAMATTDRGWRTRVLAALGTAVVTVPLFALGWVLLLPAPSALAGAYELTLELGVIPLAIAVAIAALLGPRQPAPAAPPRRGTAVFRPRLRGKP